LHEYPIDLVLNLYQAGLENQKAELKSLAVGQSIAVINALAVAFGDKEGKILANWLQALDGEPEDGPEESKPRKGSRLSPKVAAYFGAAPVKGK
jgi:hypothetical protein